MSHAQSIYYQHKSIKTNISINIEPPANFDLIYVKKIDVVDGVLQKARPLSTFQVGLWYE